MPAKEVECGDGEADTGSAHVTCLSRIALCLGFLKTKQVLLPNILFLSFQNSGSSEGEDSHGTYPSFRMQCFLVLGLQTLFLYLA